jgi:hypothetical protein
MTLTNSLFYPKPVGKGTSKYGKSSKHATPWGPGTNEQLRAALNPMSEHESGAYTLDRGQRNYEGMFYGEIPTKTRSTEEASQLVDAVFQCTEHPPPRKCWVPDALSHTYVNEHLEIPTGTIGQLCNWLVSATSSTENSTLTMTHVVSSSRVQSEETWPARTVPEDR